MLARSCSKSFKLGFNSTWTENFQMSKMNLEKAEEPEIKLPTPTGSLKKQKNSRKTSTSASLMMLKPLTVWITGNCGKFLKSWNYLAFSMIQRMLAIWSLVPLPFLKPAWTSGSPWVHILLKPGLENFEHYFTVVWDECNCAVVWAFFGIAFLWDWNENWPFPVLWPLLFS